MLKAISPPGSLPPSGPAGGDLTGTYPNPTIKSDVNLTGNPTTTTQASGDNSTKIATTAYVDTATAISQVALTVGVDHRIPWDLSLAPCAIVTITANAVLQVPTNMEAGGKYDITVISSNDAQLVFEGDDIYQFNIGSFPFFDDGKTILNFNSDGTQMACVGVNTGYIPFTPLEDSSPNSWYTTRKASAYTGTPTNITAVNDFGSNAITATKSGTGNIVLTDNALNTVAGFDFGSSNTNRLFSLGTPNISNFMPGGVMTMMAVIKPSTTDNVTRSVFSWETIFDDWYFAYNPSTNIFECWTFDNAVGGSIISGTVSNLGTSTTVLTWVKNASGNSYLYANSVLVATAVMLDSPDGTASDCEIGYFPSGSPMRGSFGDLVIWARALSDTERSNIELELMSIYGVV